MRLLEVHTCPVWQEQDGSRSIGMEPRDDHPPVVGWCNVLVLTIGRRKLRLLAVDTEGDTDATE